MTAATACLLHAPGGHFTLEHVTLDAPRADEVLVRILGVGVCHTDLVAQAGGIPMPMPAVFGHEGSGIVEAVGASVTEVAAGDAVVLSFRACGHCAQCRAEAPAYCLNFYPLNLTGARPDGSNTLHQGDVPVSAAFFGQSSFATYALAHRSNVVKVQADLPIALLGPLGCGIQTGAGAVMRSLACPAGSSILITGGGSVGLSAVLGAVVRGCATIILMEPHAARRDLALELGATHVVDPAAGPWLEAVQAAAPSGLDFVLDTTAIDDLIEAAFTLLVPRGVCGLLGIPRSQEATARASMGLMVSGGRVMRGIVEGDSDPQKFIPELIALYREGRFPFDRLITTYPLADINRAIAEQHAGLCVKPVLLT